MGLFDKISARLELFRLEQRYTKRRNRRSTFVSEAVYVDGEYIYQNPSPTKRHSVVLFSSSEESVGEDIHGIQAHYKRMEREAALQALKDQRGTAVTKTPHDGFGEYGVRQKRGAAVTGRNERSHMEGMGAMPSSGSRGNATPSKQRWGNARAANRRSMMTVQEVRWEEERR